MKGVGLSLDEIKELLEIKLEVMVYSCVEVKLIILVKLMLID